MSIGSIPPHSIFPLQKSLTMPSQHPSSSSLDRPLQNILVLGATGNIGLPIVRALAAHSTTSYTITALTRNATNLPTTFFPANVTVVSSDYTPCTLRPLFTAADAVISCLSVVALSHQKQLVDLAIECGVARFVPGEFGVNTTHPDAGTLFPLIRPKIEVRSYLRSKVREGKIGYTAIFNGSFFDWFFRFPGDMGFDVPRARATVYDGGEVKYEVTTVERIGEAVAAALAPENREGTSRRMTRPRCPLEASQ